MFLRNAQEHKLLEKKPKQTFPFHLWMWIRCYPVYFVSFFLSNYFNNYINKVILKHNVPNSSNPSWALSFLCFMRHWTEYLWVLYCWFNKSNHLKMKHLWLQALIFLYKSVRQLRNNKCSFLCKLGNLNVVLLGFFHAIIFLIAVILIISYREAVYFILLFYFYSINTVGAG